MLKFALSFIALITLTLFILNINSAEVQQWDEQTNINVVQESSFPTLSLYDEAFFEKPPLWYWATQSFQLAFGTSTWVYRMISVLSGLGIVALLGYIFSKKYSLKAGIVSVLTVLSIGHLFINNVSGYFSTHTFRSADLDALQLLLILISFLCFAHFVNGDLGLHKALKVLKIKSKEVYVILGFVFAGLAVMTKGPFGLLPIVVFGLYALIRKVKISIRSILFSLASFLIITIPWHLWMYVQHGQNFVDNFGYHILERATTAIEEHSEPFWFYIQMLFDPRVFSLGIILVPASIYFFKQKQWTFWLQGSIISILFVLVAVTIIPTKLAWYQLYIYPFAIIVLSEFYQVIKETKSENWLLAFWIQLAFGLLLNTYAIVSLGEFHNPLI